MATAPRKAGKLINWREFDRELENPPPPKKPAQPTGTPTIAPTGSLRWIVPGLLGEGLSILAGREKVGKTWLALDFAVAVAGGGRALQSVACDKGSVLYIDYENGYRRLHARLERIAPGGTYEEEPGGRTDLPKLVWFHGEVPGDVTAWFEKLRNILGDLRLIVFDAGKNLARAAGRGAWTDRGARGAVTALLENLQTWALKHGVAVLCLARTPKRGADPASSRLFGVADAILLLDRNDDRATLKVRSRDTSERTTALAFDAGRFAIVGEAGEVRYSLQRSQILEVLETSAEPVGPSEVAGALGLPLANVTKMMFRMARAGEVERRRRGRYLLPGVEKERTIWRSGMSANGDSAVKTVS